MIDAFLLYKQIEIALSKKYYIIFGTKIAA